jgi:LysM repeat protein
MAKRATAKESAPEEGTYTVGDRDSWWSIAKAVGVPINDLLAANEAKASTEITPGDSIKLPSSAKPPELVPPEADETSKPVVTAPLDNPETEVSQ